MAEQITPPSIAPYFDQFFKQIQITHPKIEPELIVIALFNENLLAKKLK